MTIQNLSKENFWDELKEKCPEAVCHFSIWINDIQERKQLDRFVWSRSEIPRSAF